MKMKTILKYSLASVIAVAAMILAVLIVGERSCGSSLTTVQFFLMKFGSMAGLYLLARLSMFLHSAGLLPDVH